LQDVGETSLRFKKASPSRYKCLQELTYILSTNKVKLKIRDDATHISSRSLILCGQAGRSNMKISGVSEVERFVKLEKGEVVVRIKLVNITGVFYFSGKVSG
jgi:hypothetical protein